MCAATPIDMNARRLARMAHNASRKRRFSADPARRFFYQRHRAARFAARFGH